MRLGLVVYGDLSIRTGGYLYDRRLVHHLRQAGVQVEVIGLPVQKYGASLLEGLRRTALPELMGGGYDGLLQDELTHPSLFRTNRALQRATGKPIVTIVHHLRSSEPHRGWLQHLYRWVEGMYLTSVNAVIANSQATWHSVRNVMGSQIPSVVAPPGRGHFSPDLSQEEIERKAYDQNPLDILFLGSVTPRKGLHHVVNALLPMERLDFRLTVIGRDQVSPRYVRSIRNSMQTAGILDRVNWLGESSDEQVQRALRAANLLIIPSSYEGFGIAYLDAMGFGAVPIGSQCGGAKELIHHGVNGFLVDPEDERALASLIDQLAGDRQRLKGVAVNAFHRYGEQPTWKEVSLTVYQFVKRFVL